MRRRPPRMFFAAVALASAVAASAQTGSDLDEIRSQIQELKKGQEAIQKDLGEIRKLLSQRPTPQARTNAVPPNTVISLEGRPSRGNAQARLAVIEFLDYQ